MRASPRRSLTMGHGADNCSARLSGVRLEPAQQAPGFFMETAESRPHAHAHYFLVVFGFVGLGYLTAVGGVNAAATPAAGVARILARTHFGMAAAERGDPLFKLHRRDCPILSAAGGANINSTGRNRSGVELVSYGWPVHRGYHAQAAHQHQRVQTGSRQFFASEERAHDFVVDFTVFR